MTEQNLNTEPGNSTKNVSREVVLREKFTSAYDEAVTFSEQYENYQKIADDFAIGFVEWCKKEENNIYFETQQLLEIYKKNIVKK